MWAFGTGCNPVNWEFEPLHSHMFNCKYCNREMNVTYLEYKSNSYCNLCFEDRADDKIKEMVMITDILKERGIFSKEIKTRIAQKQILVNGLPIEQDIDINPELDEAGNVIMLDIGDFMFSLMQNNIWALRLKIFTLEGLVSSNIKNDLTEHLKNFIIVRTSKKDIFVMKRKHKQV